MFTVQEPESRPPRAGLRLRSGRSLIYSASDLVLAAQCPWASLRTLDEKLGRVPRLMVEEDPMLGRTARLGDAHEAAVLEELRQRYGDHVPGRAGGVVEIESSLTGDPRVLRERHQESLAAVRGGADVVFQASFFDGRFHGRSDFLIRDEEDRWEVFDTKLARTPKVTALLQLAAYADQLLAEGVPVAEEATLILGTRERSSFPVGELLAVYRERRERFEESVRAHDARGEAADWWDESIGRCGACPHCLQQIEERGDVLAVAGVSVPQRRRLRERFGVRTAEDLARLEPPEGGRLPQSVAAARRQARMQLGLARPDGAVTWTDAEGQTREVSYIVEDAAPLRALPQAHPGDLFFDFEGDPLWQDPVDGSWGLEYLFGVTEVPRDPSQPPRFVPFWAHSREEEKQALLGFLDYVARRREEHPGLRIYHYANYEKRALRELAARHGVGEEQVDDLLRQEVLVDLYDAVRNSLRVSARSYSIKKLEPLYMGRELRAGDVTDAAASVVAYADHRQALEAGQEDAAREIRESIADYNRYDCVSTWRLRDWLLSLAGRDAAEEMSAPRPGPAPEPLTHGEEGDAQASPVEESLHHFVETDSPQQTGLGPEEHAALVRAVAMVSSATGYHRRERKQFWWTHYDRLSSPVPEWEEQRDVLVFERLTVEEPWHRPTGSRMDRRVLPGIGRMAEGSTLKEGASRLFGMYSAPFPPYLEDRLRESWQQRNPSGVEGPIQLRVSTDRLTVRELRPTGSPGRFHIRVEETLPVGQERFDQLPMALTPPAPIPTKAQEAALAQLAEEVDAALPHLPLGAGLDLLARREPRLLGGAPLPRPEDPEHAGSAVPMASAIYAAMTRLDDSYLAVQGPPGTGKSFVGSKVIGRLVADGWRIGVVAQSHAVVENLLRGCLRNGGVHPDAVAKIQPKTSGKKGGSGAQGGTGTQSGPGTQGSTGQAGVVQAGAVPADSGQTPSEQGPPWRQISAKDIPAFLDGADGPLGGPAGGRIYGGTAWDFANEDRFEPGVLDLLVIDEAGQYSLANMLAVSRAARRLLLLGDPQQLPQVSQGSHPQPVDESALGWLSAGARTLPERYGYFLDASWRMHPQVCRPVSELSYQGRLHSASAASQRELQDLEPGVYRRDVPHTGNATSSEEEAREVVALARQIIGRAWRPGPGESPRELRPEDVLVVAAYNAQVDLISRHLAEAGLSEEDGSGVRVGTVDKFQGQEAPVVLVSMAASSAAEVPRGMDFLLSPNRLNVAVSRGQWAAVIVSSPHLTDYWPATPEGLSILGGFTRLRQGARPWPAPPTGGTA